MNGVYRVIWLRANGFTITFVRNQPFLARRPRESVSSARCPRRVWLKAQCRQAISCCLTSYTTENSVLRWLQYGELATYPHFPTLSISRSFSNGAAPRLHYALSIKVSHNRAKGFNIQKHP